MAMAITEDIIPRKIKLGYFVKYDSEVNSVPYILMSREDAQREPPKKLNRCFDPHKSWLH